MSSPLFSIMGIVNITPDSFSDGGRFFEPEFALKHALQLIEDGADIIDLGGESTRPGSPGVSLEDEWQRLAPTLKALAPRLPPQVRLSVDTSKASIMLRALDVGATIINNVCGLTDFATLQTIARVPQAAYITMHMHGIPETMQKSPLRNGAKAIKTVEEFFATQQQTLRRAGFDDAAIFMDPGIGFGKSDQANLHLMAHTHSFAQRYNLVLGVSRKSWLGRLLGIADPELRDPPAKIAEFTLGLSGAKIIRTHEVRTLALLRRAYSQIEL
jgi:dihydropteroate synthase